jgi:hypothetical protein
MNITTSPKIWAHSNFLTVVHQANEIIEREAGAKSEALAVYWGLVATESTSGFTLQVTVVDAASSGHLRRGGRFLPRWEARFSCLCEGCYRRMKRLARA